jgi:hypothetical protein
MRLDNWPPAEGLKKDDKGDCLIVLITKRGW